MPLPKFATEGSAGADLYAAITSDLLLKPWERQFVPTGISIALPMGYEAQIRPRSGLAFKHGITVINSPGTIDSDYRGEIKVCLINLSDNEFTISREMRIAQMIISKYESVEWVKSESLSGSNRGSGGFGHSGE